MNYTKLREEILAAKVDIDSLSTSKSTFVSDYSSILDGTMNKKDINAYIRLCLDYYAYSESGDVLITDREYDNLMNYWIGLGNEKIVYPDVISGDSTWPFVKHEMPGMVGTVSKVYSPEELAKYLDKHYGITQYVVAPKYDGISTCIKVSNGSIDYAVTRADGVTGQNITAVVRGAKNATYFAKDATGQLHNGYYKCELCVGQSDFEELITEKAYKNRRSATSGIINSPKNLSLARFVTIIPLLYNDGKDNLEYHPAGMWLASIKKPSDAMTEIHRMLDIIKARGFPFRTDGVILYPLDKDLRINHNDYMDEAIAYKINTAEGKTKIKYGYMSIGRLGNAIPMVKVEPVEVNETIVEDVSLSSYDKYAGMDLHENETVIIYSAGDVIPQLKVCEPREYNSNSPYLKIPRTCPYCNEALERIGSEYKCTNPNCPRLITGRITNFLVKLGAENISDKTIELLYENRLVRTIQDLFELTAEDLKTVPGIEELSASNIIEELKRIFTTPIPVSKVFGAIGIPNVSEKKCRGIFKVIDADSIAKSSPERLYMSLLNADGIGSKTAEVFVSFVKENRSLIDYLMKHMNITNDVMYNGNIVFTGFRNKELSDKIRSYGYDVVDSVNNQTIAVVDASASHESEKCKSAIKKGISVISLSNIDDLLTELKIGKVRPSASSQRNSVYSLNSNSYADISSVLN